MVESETVRSQVWIYIFENHLQICVFKAMASDEIACKNSIDFWSRVAGQAQKKMIRGRKNDSW